MEKEIIEIYLKTFVKTSKSVLQLCGKKPTLLIIKPLLQYIRYIPHSHSSNTLNLVHVSILFYPLLITINRFYGRNK